MITTVFEFVAKPAAPATLGAITASMRRRDLGPALKGALSKAVRLIRDARLDSG
jgi:hypothetical protein